MTISRKVTKACNLFPERKIDKEIIKSILKIVVEDSHKNVTNYRRLNVWNYVGRKYQNGKKKREAGGRTEIINSKVNRKINKRQRK